MAKPETKRRLAFAMRLVLSCGLLAVLIAKVPDLDGLVPNTHRGRAILFLVVALALAVVGVGLSAWRWQRVFIALGVEVQLRALISIYLASSFVGNVLPSTIGGDVLRVSRVGSRVGSTQVAFASVALERLSGFIALPILVFIGFALRPSLLDVDHAILGLLVGVIALAVLALIIFLAGHPRLAGRFTDNENWTRFLGAAHTGVIEFRRAPLRTFEVLLTAMIYQASVIACVVLISAAMDLDLPIAALVAFVPAVAMVQVLPLSISGLGVREGLLVYFLTPLGITRGHSISLGLLWYASMLLTSALGAPSFLAGHRSTAFKSSPAA